jgi:tetrahydromethanopterin S-methyltransferase subunit G
VSRFDRVLPRRGATRATTPTDEQQAIVARLDALEAMIEGLQDSVDREMQRVDDRLDELSRRLEPSEIARNLSDDARRRGL